MVINSLCQILWTIIVYVVTRSLSLYDNLQTHHSTHKVLLGLATSDGHTPLHHIVARSPSLYNISLTFIMISP